MVSWSCFWMYNDRQGILPTRMRVLVSLQDREMRNKRSGLVTRFPILDFKLNSNGSYCCRRKAHRSILAGDDAMQGVQVVARS